MKSSIKKAILTTAGVIVFGIVGVVVYVSYFLPDVGAAPYIEVEVTPERVARGEYLANSVAVCMDCHSSRDWSKFSGPLLDGSLGKGGEYFGPEFGFPGKFYARNLTPANLGDWTDGEIFRAITTGVNREGKVIFPIMPYKNYGKMAEEDIYDIIAYLRTLPPVENEIPASSADFPMNFVLNTIPKKAVPTPRPPKSDKVKYGEYLTNAAACIECHTPASKGGLDLSMSFAGGREFRMPGGLLRSGNITPHKGTGIGNWSEEDFVGRFKAYADPNSLASVEAEDYNSLMPWSMYARLETEDLQAIYAYLQTLKPIENQVVVWE